VSEWGSGAGAAACGREGGARTSHEALLLLVRVSEGVRE
jgi:hypothetical protein